MKGPSEQSTKRPVSRVREIPGLQKAAGLYQDPRFDTALGKSDLRSARRNYQFLDAYRQSEIDELRGQLKKARTDEDRELLGKTIQSQRSRLETLKRRDEEEEILKHVGNKKMSRAKKRELVLKERFNRMSSKDVARTVERRRRKVAQKQKKLLPERRNVE